MKQFDWSTLSSILPSVTAIIAILVPAISSGLSARSQERIKKMEMHVPHVYDALSEMTKSYSSLSREGEQLLHEKPYEMLQVAQARYEDFRSAAYKVLSLVPGLDIQQQISKLLDAIYKNGLHASPTHDALFFELLNSINSSMLSAKVKTK